MEKESSDSENPGIKQAEGQPHRRRVHRKKNKIWYKRRKVKKRLEMFLWIALLALFLVSLVLVWPSVMTNAKMPGKEKTK